MQKAQPLLIGLLISYVPSDYIKFVGHGTDKGEHSYFKLRALLILSLGTAK